MTPPGCFDFLTTSDDGGWNNLYILTLREELSHMHIRAEELSL